MEEQLPACSFRRSPLFAAFTKAEAVKRKAQARDISPDSQEPLTFGD
jgi:hypothetical protein